MLGDRQVMFVMLMRGKAKMTAGLTCEGVAELTYGGPGRGRFPRGRGEASYRDDFLADMVEPNDLWRLAFIEVTADGITNFPVKFRKGVSLGENRHAERACGEPTLRRIFHHEDQFAHSHSLKAKSIDAMLFRTPRNVQLGKFR